MLITQQKQTKRAPRPSSYQAVSGDSIAENAEIKGIESFNLVETTIFYHGMIDNH